MRPVDLLIIILALNLSGIGIIGVFMRGYGLRVHSAQVPRGRGQWAARSPDHLPNRGHSIG
jgi:hypothetical protein